MKKLLCQGVWEADSKGFAETPWIQLVLSASLQDSLNQLQPHSPSKDQAWVHSWLLFTCQLISTSQKVDLPLCTAASLSRSWDSKEAALKGLKTEARLWLGPYCSCTHASSQLPHSFQNIGKIVRQRCAMHRVWFSPEFTNSFGIYLKKAGRRMNKF